MDEVYFRAYDGSRSLWSTVLNIGAFPVTRDWIFGDEITRDHQQRNMPMVLQNSGLYRTTSSYLVVYLVPGVAQPGLLPRYFESIVTERYVTLICRCRPRDRLWCTTFSIANVVTRHAIVTIILLLQAVSAMLVLRIEHVGQSRTKNGFKRGSSSSLHNSNRSFNSIQRQQQYFHGVRVPYHRFVHDTFSSAITGDPS